MYYSKTIFILALVSNQLDTDFSAFPLVTLDGLNRLTNGHYLYKAQKTLETVFIYSWKFYADIRMDRLD